VTNREVRRFLKSEGWTQEDEWGTYVDPRGNPKGTIGYGVALAYRIAKRRRDARECDRLKKAGWRVWKNKGFKGRWRNPGGYSVYTKSQALAILDGKL